MIGSQKVRFNASRTLKFVIKNSMAFMKTNYSLSLFSILLVTNKDHRCRNDVCTSSFQRITLMQTMQHIRCYISANSTHTHTQSHSNIYWKYLSWFYLIYHFLFLIFCVISSPCSGAHFSRSHYTCKWRAKGSFLGLQPCHLICLLAG